MPAPETRFPSLATHLRGTFLFTQACRRPCSSQLHRLLIHHLGIVPVALLCAGMGGRRTAGAPQLCEAPGS